MTFDPPCLFIYVISQGGPEDCNPPKKKFNNNNALALTHEKFLIYCELEITSTVSYMHSFGLKLF